MTILLGFRNQRFDNAVPLYVDISNGMVLNRLNGKQLTLASLNAAMTAESYTPKTGEIGKAPQAWLDANHGWWDGQATAPTSPPAATPITATLADNATATVKVTFAGGPASKAGTVSLGPDVGTGPAKTIAGLPPVAIAKNDTAAVVAGKVATALNGKQDTAKTVTLAASAAGAVITVTEAGTAVVDLTVTIA